MQERERWLSLLEEKGCRITGPRLAIVDLLVNSNKAVGPLDLYDQARQTYPKMGLVTVYRTLEILLELGLIERVHQPDGCHMVLRAAKGHQHLMLCTRCGKATYFSGDDLGGLIEKISDESGFAITEHWLQLYGLGQECH